MSALRCEALTARGRECLGRAKWYAIEAGYAGTDTCLPAITLAAWCPVHRDYEKHRARPVVEGGPFTIVQPKEREGRK